MPLGNDAGIFDALIMGGGAIVMYMVDPKAPSAILPQGAVPFSMVGLLIATFEAIGEGGALALVGLVFRNGTCL